MNTNSLQEQTTQWAHDGIDALKEGALQLRDKAQSGTDATVHYIQREPIKSVLIAAATGAALMALLGLMSTRSR